MASWGTKPRPDRCLTNHERHGASLRQRGPPTHGNARSPKLRDQIAAAGARAEAANRYEGAADRTLDARLFFAHMTVPQAGHNGRSVPNLTDILY
jgi:hypothetical protein